MPITFSADCHLMLCLNDALFEKGAAFLTYANIGWLFVPWSRYLPFPLLMLIKVSTYLLQTWLMYSHQ